MNLDTQRFALLMQQKNYGAALALISEARLVPAQHAELMLTRAQLNMMHQRFAAAYKDCAKLTKAKLIHPDVANIEAQSAIELGDYPAARQALKRLSNHKTHQVPYLKLSAKLEFENNQYAKAINFCDKVIALDPKESAFLLFKANAQIAQRNYQEALTTFEQLKEIDGQYGKYSAYIKSLSALIRYQDETEKQPPASEAGLKLAVITPIGPGHQQAAKKCHQSVKRLEKKLPSQTLFSEIEHIQVDDTKGELGRSKARNNGIEQAINNQNDWIFFLDADDEINPDLLAIIAPHLTNHDCVWGGIYSGLKTGPYHFRLNQIPYLDNIQDYALNDPFLTLQMGHFVKTELLAKNGIRFNEDKDCAEDVEFYLNELSHGKGMKIPEPFFYNVRGVHSTGPRSASGNQWDHDSQATLKRYLQENELTSKVSLDGVETHFVITNPFDLVQKSHIKGSYFEQKELEELAKYIEPNSQILEVGANVGNHGIFYLQQCQAKHVDFVEPNPTALNILKRNIELNEIDSERYTIHEVGAGATVSSFSIDEVDNNLGASSLNHDEGGSIQVLPLDELKTTSQKINFIKVDVEGMEMDVLAGAEKLFQQHKPLMYIEVANENKPAFKQWMDNQHYQLVLEHKAVHASNYLVKAS